MTPTTAHSTPGHHALAHAGAVLARADLVTAFGHVSTLLDGGRMLITPPVPLGRVDAARCIEVPLDVDALPAGVPLEAWLHLAVYRARPDVGAVCRAQPERLTALAAAGVCVPPLTGHAVVAGAPVPISRDAVLARDPATAIRAVASLGDGHALVLRGNGALTVGRDVGAAVARMWLLERAARSTVIAASVGEPTALPADAVASWRQAADELLARIWTHLDEAEAIS
ncbi:class II aldolase/adducin family protein [Pseudonocardia sp. TRM90224]|uniref:class II aldolase/adducin family protein n=1 Tax=Pseudonocardia sp. TRM90224 TaxID=2812678 RepID=UPI001E38806D|nr:class II aldolase/adducin family protein [Pseudonocardia sp. TRM90224]